MPSMGYRLGQINPETFVTSITRIVEETIEKTDRRRGQGGRPLGDTTRRGGEDLELLKVLMDLLQLNLIEW